MLRSFPFTADTYLSLFEAYNGTIWPAQVVAYGLGILAVLLALRPLAAGGRIAFAVLSVFWLWNGIAYHLMHFFQINFAALGFAALFALQGVLFAASRSAAVAASASGRMSWAGPACSFVCSRWWPIRCSAGLRAMAGHGRRRSGWRRRRP